MFSTLKNHPFAVEAYFESSLVLTFAVPKEPLACLLPACLELDIFQNKWAFVAVAMVQTKGLRPKGLPSFLGNDFFLIGYRIFVRYTTSWGKRLRGLYILKSETNKKKMEFLGNVFTHYNYTTTDIKQKIQGKTSEISSSQSDFRLLIDIDAKDVQLPQSSPFQDWTEARRYAGPLPFTFTYQPKNQQVLLIEGVRQHWIPTPVQVIDYNFSFMNHMNLPKAVLANAFIIKDIAYEWKKGKLDLWKP